jgi:hypothetical protein
MKMSRVPIEVKVKKLTNEQMMNRSRNDKGKEEKVAK